MEKFKIENIEIGGDKIVFIAEIGLCHNGSVEIAKTLIDLAKDAGADIVKFQKRDVNTLATEDTLDAEDNRFPTFGKTYREVREYIEFSKEEYIEIVEHCKKREILFSCTPFDLPSLSILEELDTKMYKVASHGLTNIPLLKGVAKTNKLTILSTGMCTYDEIDSAVKIFEDEGTPLVLLHCVSSYPTNHDEANLQMILKLKDRYKKIIGLSTHEQGILATIAGAAIGAKVIERHITLDHNLEGFDHKIAVDPYEMRELVTSLSDIEKMLKFKEKSISEAEQVTRDKYRVSLISRGDIAEGSIITKENLICKNPGTGIPSKDMDKIIGKRAKVNIVNDTLISWDMVL